jgi:hypothetical protein
MKVVYIANDGTEFDQAEECLKYEKENPLFRMWGITGATIDPGLAEVVWFANPFEARKQFVELCSDRRVTTEGIEVLEKDTFFDIYDTYVWDDENFEWKPISDSVLTAIEHLLKEKE